MWANLLRFVGEEGISVQELSRKAGYPPRKVHPDLAGMTRWRYVTNDGANPKSPKMNDTIRLTAVGAKAAQTWEPLVAEIEQRWVLRFGHEAVARLKWVLVAIVEGMKRPLPHYFPTLYHRQGMRGPVPHQPECDPPSQLALPYLASQLHHLFTLEADQQSEISLALRSNVLRVVDTDPIAKKELPSLAGISKEALSMSINYLKKQDLMLEAPSATERGKVVWLTEQGQAEKERYHDIVDSVEQAWREKVSTKVLGDLRAALEPFVVPETAGQPSPLFQGLEAAPQLWRGQRRKRNVLPYHPMVLYRGGWPDGS